MALSSTMFGAIKGQKDADNLLSYLNNQPDMLTAIIKQRTSFKGRTGDIFILPLPKTRDKMIVAVHPPPSEEAKQVDIMFDPPMQDFREFRPRVLKWRDEAYKHYNVPAKPAIEYFSLPGLFPFTVPIAVLFSLLLFALYGRGYYADWWRSKIIDTFGVGMIPGAKWFTIVVHIAEALYMAWAMTQYRVPFVPAVKWVLFTLILGFAGISEFWESIQYERLRVIYRQTDVGEIPHRLAAAGSVPTTAAAKPESKPTVKGNKKKQ